MRPPPLAEGYYALFIENLRCEMRIGVNPDERKPQLVQFDIAAIVQRLGPGDGIEDVPDYNHLRDTVIELAAAKHYGLQETLCEQVIENLMGHRFIHGVMIETRKLNVYADANSVGCHMIRIKPYALAGAN